MIDRDRVTSKAFGHVSIVVGVQNFRFDGFLFFVGAASCRDWLAVAAGCRSYKKEVFKP
jgi:hypothetical protein